MRGVPAWETKKKGVGVTHLQIKAEHSNTEYLAKIFGRLFIKSRKEQAFCKKPQKGKEKRCEKKKKTKQQNITKNECSTVNS